MPRDMPSFLDQDRPKKVKEIYSALKRDHPDMPAEMKARIAARQGKRGKQKQGPPYKAPVTAKYKEAMSPAWKGALGGGIMGGALAGSGGNPETRLGRILQGAGAGAVVGGLGGRYVNPVLGTVGGGLFGGVAGKSGGYLHQRRIERLREMMGKESSIKEAKSRYIRALAKRWAGGSDVGGVSQRVRAKAISHAEGRSTAKTIGKLRRFGARGEARGGLLGRAQQAAARGLESATRTGARIGGKFTKAGASKKSAPYQQSRKGRRPIRVHNLLKKAAVSKERNDLMRGLTRLDDSPEAIASQKERRARYLRMRRYMRTGEHPALKKKASMAGQDLRTPLMGGTKMPTDDSKSFAQKQLSKHQSIGVPKVPKTTDITSVIPRSPGSINLMPKVGEDMSIKNDPLVQYLAKQAMSLEDNEADMETGKGEQEIASAPPEMPSEHANKGVSNFESYVAQAFSRKSSKRKYEGKDYPATSGQVDKVLGRS